MAVFAINSGGTATTNIMVRGVNIGNATSGHTTLSAALGAATHADTICWTENYEVVGTATISLRNITLTADDSSWFGVATSGKHEYGAGARITSAAGHTITYSAGAPSGVPVIERLQFENTDAASDVFRVSGGSTIIRIRACTIHNHDGGYALNAISNVPVHVEFSFVEIGDSATGIFNQTGTDLLVKCWNVTVLKSHDDALEGFLGNALAEQVQCVNCYVGDASGITSVAGNYGFCAAPASPSSVSPGYNGSSKSDSPGTVVYNNRAASSLWTNVMAGSFDVTWGNPFTAQTYVGGNASAFYVASRDIEEEALNGTDFYMGADFLDPVTISFSGSGLFDFMEPDAVPLGDVIDGWDDWSGPADFMTPNPTITLPASVPLKSVSGLLSKGLSPGTDDIKLFDFMPPDGVTPFATLDGMIDQFQADGFTPTDFSTPNPSWTVTNTPPPPFPLKGVSGLLEATPGDPADGEIYLSDSIEIDETKLEEQVLVDSEELRKAVFDFMLPQFINLFIPEGGADGTAEVIEPTVVLTGTFDAPATAPDNLIQVNTQLLGEVVAESDLALINQVPFIVYGIDILSTADLDEQHVPNGLPFLVDASFSEGPGNEIYDEGGRANYIGVRTASGMVFRPPVDKEVALYVQVLTDLSTSAIQPGTGKPIGFRRYEARSTPTWHPYKPVPEKALESQYVYQILDPDEIYRYYSLLVGEMYIIWQNLNRSLTKLLSPDETLDEWLDLLAEQYLIPLDRSKGFGDQRKSIKDWLRVPRVRGTSRSVIVPIRDLNYYGVVYEIWADPEEPIPDNWDDVADAPAAIQTHMMTIGIYDDQVTESGQKGIDFVVVPHGFFHEVPVTPGNFYPTGRLAVILYGLDQQPIPFGSLTTSEFEELRDALAQALNEVIPAHSDIRLFADGIEVSGSAPPHEALEISDLLATTTIPFIINPTPTLLGSFVVS